MAEQNSTTRTMKKKVPFTYPALALTQNRHKFYFSTIPVQDLFPWCFVSRRDVEPINGFQRALNENRADDIARYLAKGKGSIPTNIVLSAQTKAKFSYLSRPKTINFERIKNAFLVLDGQHRLWGYQLCLEKHDIGHRVPVAIYDGLTRAEEAGLFIDINTTQRGVPAALLLDIKQVAQVESVLEQTLRAIFDQLSTDANSPLTGKLSKSKSARGKISRVSFNRALEPVMRSPIMLDLDSGDRQNLLLNYLNAFDAELEDKKLLFRTAFFEAIFDIFDEVIRTTTSQYRDAKQVSLQKIIRPIAKIDYSSSSLVSKKSLTEAMKSILRKNISITSEML